MSRKRKILHIDDDEIILDMMAAMLRRAGEYDFVSACSGEEGIEKALVSIPDLIFLDVRMPGMDGRQTLKKLQDMALIREIPVVFVTGLADDVESLRRLPGVVDVILKPFKIKDTKAVIEKIFSALWGAAA